MQLDELKESVSSMSDTELINQINLIRAHRRKGTTVFAVTMGDARRKEKSTVGKKNEMLALLHALELDMDDEGEEPEDA